MPDRQPVVCPECSKTLTSQENGYATDCLCQGAESLPEPELKDLTSTAGVQSVSSSEPELKDLTSTAGVQSVSSSEPVKYGTPGDVTQEIATVQAIYEAFERRDIEGMIQHVDDNCLIDVPGTSALVGRTEPYRGPEGVRQYFRDASQTWEELTLHAEDIRAAAGGVAVFGHVRAMRGGETVRRRIIWLWEIRDGKAIQVRANDLGDLE